MPPLELGAGPNYWLENNYAGKFKNIFYQQCFGTYFLSQSTTKYRGIVKKLGGRGERKKSKTQEEGKGRKMEGKWKEKGKEEEQRKKGKRKRKGNKKRKGRMGKKKCREGSKQVGRVVNR